MKGKPAEGQTPIDDISGLRLSITTREELDRAEFANNLKCSKQYFLKRLQPADAPFTYAWLLEVHREMFGDIWEWAGRLRKTEKPVGVPAVKIGSELHAFTSEYHRREKEKPQTLETSVWLHHKLVWIHPFENGNGRWARMITNIYRHLKGLAMIQWPTDIQMFRPAYIQALKAGDQGDLKPLAELQNQYGLKG